MALRVAEKADDKKHRFGNASEGGASSRSGAQGTAGVEDDRFSNSSLVDSSGRLLCEIANCSNVAKCVWTGGPVLP